MCSAYRQQDRRRATANHPFGFLEAAILAAVLRRVRPDFKIMANSLLASVPELRAGFIFVNPYGGGASIQENRMPMRECLEWLAKGGMLALFLPETSHV